MRGANRTHHDRVRVTEAGKSLPRWMQAEGEANASLMKHGIEDLEDQPHESLTT